MTRIFERLQGADLRCRWISFAPVQVLQKITIPGAVVALGRHAGKADLDNRNFSEEERAILHGLSPRKQSEWIASRDLLYAITDFPERPSPSPFFQKPFPNLSPTLPNPSLTVPQTFLTLS